MRKDTRTFFTTILGVPLTLSLLWGIHSADAGSVVTYEREPIAPLETAPITAPEPVATSAAPKPKVQKVIVVPVSNPTPVQTVPVPVPVTPVVVTTAPAPVVVEQPVVTVRSSRRTRAS